MSSFNRITLLGRLGRDPEIKTTKAGKPVCNFSLATTEKRQGGESTTWFNCTAWEKTAEIVQKYVTKGHLLLVEGRMTCEEYEKDGQKKQAWKVVADRVVLMPKGSSLPQKTGEDHAAAAAADKEPDLESIPF